MKCYQRRKNPRESSHSSQASSSTTTESDGLVQTTSLRTLKTSERVDLNGRDFGKGNHNEHSRGPGRDVEIRIKLQISVDSPLTENPESNSDGTRAFSVQVPASTQKPFEADHCGMAQSTPQIKEISAASRELVERGLKTETLVIIVLSIRVGFMTGFIVCR